MESLADQSIRRHRREMLRKRKSSLMRKVDELHRLCNVEVLFLVRADRETMLYSSDTSKLLCNHIREACKIIFT